MVNPRTGRVHTNYAQAVAVTGRLSSNDPNLQNIPVRTAEGRRIREAFIAPPGSKIVSADYSQIELRIMAHLSGDKGLIDAFARGEDMHRHTAAEVFGVAAGRSHERAAPLRQGDQLRPHLRHERLRPRGQPRHRARGGARATWTSTSSAIRAWRTTWSARATRRSERGYVETVFGRRLWLPDIALGQPGAPPGRRARRRSTRPCRARRPT